MAKTTSSSASTPLTPSEAITKAMKVIVQALTPAEQIAVIAELAKLIGKGQ
jgi:hypothetical protein